ncbi:hypothetical protein TRVL_02523 [Trypanosoma vivax]|nr:hypothetical protein TRVL_02523 [Trypanosoma vivax]
MKVLGDVYRQTFPKKLRFDKSSRILHAEVYVLCKRHKHKKYIPKQEIFGVLNGYEPLPGSPWLQLPVVRHLLLVRIINSIRCFFGRKSWLINRGVEEEFTKIKRWMEQEERLMAKLPVDSRTRNFVLRDKFEKEVLASFHVATVYHHMVRAGATFAIFLVLYTFAAINVDWLVHMYLVRWMRMNRSEVLEWFREVTERHVVAETPPAYRGLLPPPCVLQTTTDGREHYRVQATELVSPNDRIIVLAVPCPQIGPRNFFTALGQSMKMCDAVLMEGVPFDRIGRVAPASLLPLRDDTFPSIGVHHRFLDIVRGSGEPPFLYPAGTEISWRAYWRHVFTPFELSCVYWPTSFSASKGEARIGWGRLRELIERIDLQMQEEQSNGETGSASPYVVCLPWTVNHIVNIEASLIKYGFHVKRVFPIDWMARDHMGECFCVYHNISEQ